MTGSPRYFGSWDTWEEMRNSWFDRRYNYETRDYEPLVVPEDFPTDEQVLFASYGGAMYEGDATVVFERDGKVYENHGGHCSCYGLEGQWDPEETTWAALAKKERKSEDSYFYFLRDHEDQAREAYWALVDARAGDDPVGR